MISDKLSTNHDIKRKIMHFPPNDLIFPFLGFLLFILFNDSPPLSRSQPIKCIFQSYTKVLLTFNFLFCSQAGPTFRPTPSKHNTCTTYPPVKVPFTFACITPLHSPVGPEGLPYFVQIQCQLKFLCHLCSL